jgi:putative DNA primase/helicase
MEEIVLAFNEQGLNPGALVLDGKIHRFKSDTKDQKKSAWYTGYQNHLLKSGEVFHVVVFGNFKTGETWTYQTQGAKVSREDKKIINEQIKKAKEAEAKLRAQNQELVAAEIKKKWNDLLDSGQSSYLDKKKISEVENLGVKYDLQGSVYIPARDSDGKLWSWQKIQWDGAKWFHPGGRIFGSYHTVGDLKKYGVIYITEGFATAASIHAATRRGVVVAFTSNNLVQVSRTIKKLYPGKSIIVCGDDDHWSTKANGEPCNSGREKAEEAAKAVLGKATFPEFKDLSEKPTDFNDLHCLEGIEKVSEQILGVKPKKASALYGLGFRDNSYFFTSTSNRQINEVISFNEDNLLKLMPLEYWESQFPGEKAAVDWKTAKSELMSQCRKRGIFSGKNVRGSGVWMDAGRIVVNMGDHLLVDGDRCDFGEIKTKYFYALSDNMKPLHEKPLSIGECEILVDACNTFKWSRGRDAGILMAGALVLSRVCGALPVRPHVWITGGAQTGKTTLLQKLVTPILGENSIAAEGNSTEAGLRQTLKHNALPIFFDEFETEEGKRTSENIAACLELMRSAWSSGGARILKGSATGTATSYNLQFSAIVSSIRLGLKNDADKSRFTVLELAPHGSDEDHWDHLSGLLSEIDDDYSERLFSRTVSMVPVILENYKIIKKVFARTGGARFGDQYGMLIAGFSSLIFDGVMGVDDAELVIKEMEFEEFGTSEIEADHNEALGHLLTSKIRLTGRENTYEDLVGNLIRDYLAGNDGVSSHTQQAQAAMGMQPDGRTASLKEIEKTLNNLGIRPKVEKDGKTYVAIVSSNHAELSKIWRGTKWNGNWSTPLGRIDNAIANKPVRVSGKVSKCVLIPASHF